MPASKPRATRLALSVIVPTYNERANVAALVERVSGVLSDKDWELIFVDDSTDGTDGLVAGLASTDGHIRLLHRDRPSGGLAGAVLEGFRMAVGVYCCVLDGDLQHPPEVIPHLLERAEATNCDLVIASRYLPEAGAGGLDGPARLFGSLALKWLSCAAFPRRIGGLTDPLSGFFLVRRDLANKSHLRPLGYKILLEVLVRCQWQCVDEVSYHFQNRAGGTSKSNLRQALRFLRHLGRLTWDCSPAFAPVRFLALPWSETGRHGRGRVDTPQ